MENWLKITLSILLILLFITISLSIFFNATPTGKAMWNNWFHNVEKADDNTSYENRKKVEDACRSMIASYNSDKLIYEQYKDSENEQKQSWAEQAKMRANKTASTYNNYIRENSYIWENNVPNDIDYQLQYIQ